MYIKAIKGEYQYFYQIPGRMGMIVTLYLISSNVYNSVEGPSSRGFSNIELWMVGSQFPILLALFEYGFILYLKKTARKVEDHNQKMDIDDSKPDISDRIKTLDFVTMTISFLFIVFFSSTYWIVLHK